MTTIINTLKRLSSPSVPTTLHTLQPTPSTVTYTVSTRRRRESKSVIDTILQHVRILIRITIGLVVLAVFGAKFGAKDMEVGRQWAGGMRRRGELGVAVLEWLNWFGEVLDGWKGGYVLLGGLWVFYMVLKRGYKEESLTVIRGLGLQTSTTSSLYLRTPTTRFIPTTSIQDIFIHEAFKGFEVKFYIAVLVHGEKDAVIVFPTLLPRLGILEVVWRGSRRCLWNIERKEEGGGGKDEDDQT